MVSNISGVVSGMDTNAIIDAMVNVEKIQINNWAKQKSGLNVKISKIGEIKSKLNDLTDFLGDFKTEADILGYTGSSSDSEVLDLSTNGSALPGSYAVEVNQLAVAEKNRSNAFTGAADEVKEGTLKITVKDEDVVEVAITEGMTVLDTVDAINASDASVFASLINDGTNTYIQLASKDTGHVIGGAADDAIKIAESYTGGTGSELNFTQITQAANATFTLDGLDVEQQSNTVTDVLEGITLTLKKTGTTQVTIDADKAATKENIETFVEKYNAALTLVAKDLKSTENTDFNYSLAGDSTLKRLKSDMMGVISGFVTGATGSFAALSQIGIKTDATGKLKIDADDLDEAMNKDMSSISSLFTATDTGISDLLTTKIEVYTEDLEGLFKTKVDSYNDLIDRLDDNISDKEREISSLVTRLKKQFSAMEMAMNNINLQGGALASLG